MNIDAYVTQTPEQAAGLKYCARCGDHYARDRYEPHACPDPTPEEEDADEMTEDIHYLMALLTRQEAESATKAEALQAALSNLPEQREWMQAQEAASLTREALRAALESTEGVQDTPHGKVGYQLRRSLTYSPALVRELCPDLAPLVIAEVVDGKALLSLAKTAAKSGKVSETLAADLEARAEVKTTKAWICQPALPLATA